MSLKAALTEAGEDEEHEDSDEETTDDDMYKVGDNVRVWWEQENAWFNGEVEKISAKTVLVYYPAPSDGEADSFSTHYKHNWTIERLAGVGEKGGEGEEGDGSEGDDE